MGHKRQRWLPVDECFLLESTSAFEISATRYKQTTQKNNSTRKAQYTTHLRQA